MTVLPGGVPVGIGKVSSLDAELFRRVVAARTPPADAVLPRLSRAADHGLLWLAVACGLGVSGGRRRRAALRGLLALSLSSAAANGPVKLLVRRGRPPLADVPLARRVRRQPRTRSFPSGHAASAAAFACGLALEAPAVAAPVGLLAAAVASSRVYVGVHYPGDVLAGALLGAGAALLTTKVMPRRPAAPVRARPAAAAAPALPDGDGLIVVVNAGAGQTRRSAPADALRAALPRAEVVEVGPGEDLGEAVRSAARRARALGVAGGDGTVNAAAAERGVPLAVVPAGTLDHFAADVGLDGVDGTVEAIRAGSAVAVDLGRVDGADGWVFLNTASAGGYPEIVEMRERLEPRLGKWPSLLVALVRVLHRDSPLELEIDGIRRRVWLLFVGNGVYHPSGFAPTFRERLDEGLLDVRLVDGSSPFARSRLVLALLTGRLGRCRVYEQVAVPRLRVRSPGGPLRFARDGEVGEAPAEFTLSSRRGQLVVYRPEAASRR